MKNKKIDWLVSFIGVVFLGAAIFRIFHYSAGVIEFTQLGTPLFLLPFIIILEIVLGILFIFNRKVVYASLTAIIFLIIAIIIALMSNFEYVIKNISELFVFNATPTDILLHLTYVILLFIIFLKHLKKKN